MTLQTGNISAENDTQVTAGISCHPETWKGCYCEKELGGGIVCGTELVCEG